MKLSNLAHKTVNDCIYLSSAQLHRHNAYIYGKFKLFHDPEYEDPNFGRDPLFADPWLIL